MRSIKDVCIHMQVSLYADDARCWCSCWLGLQVVSTTMLVHNGTRLNLDATIVRSQQLLELADRQNQDLRACVCVSVFRKLSR